MPKQLEIPEEVFEAMLYEAIEDLRKSGLDPGEIFFIIEEHFGRTYACKFCGESKE